MSEVSQGADWWQASDGRWYPPTREPLQTPLPPPAGPVPTAGKATTALVLAIGSFIVCPLVAAVASLFVAAGAKRQIRDSDGRLGGQGLVTAANVLAIVNIVLSVVVGLAVVAAIAIPTFLGAKVRAQDRATQTDLRTALVAQKTLATDADGEWTDDPSALATVEPSLRFEIGDVPVAGKVIYVAVDGELLGLGAKSESGTCFYVISDAADDTTGFAEDAACRALQDQEFVDSW